MGERRLYEKKLADSFKAGRVLGYESLTLPTKPKKSMEGKNENF